MGGPGVRYAEFARVLASRFDVVLAAPAGSDPIPTPARFAVYDPRRPASVAALTRGARAVVAPPLAPALLAGVRAPWVCDLYNPEPFEGLEAHPGVGGRRLRALDALRVDRLAYAARTADAFVCAGERQRDMWLGFLAAERRVTSAAHRADRELLALIDIVPAGVPDAPPPVPTGPPLRGSALAADARIVVWNGGLWAWLDPGLAARAVATLHARDPRWTLVVAGAGDPSRRAAGTAEAGLAAVRAELSGGGLHEMGEWTPYADRGDVLLEADVGVCTHPPGVESRFAERTRLLDLAWAGAPIVAAEGDPLAALVRSEGLGRVVAPGDAAALAAALEVVAGLGREAFAPALARFAAGRRWSVVTAPLVAAVERVAGRPPRRSGAVARALAARHATARRISRG